MRAGAAALRWLRSFPGPVRTLAAAESARATGFGFLLSVGVLYATRTVGLSAQQAGLAMTVAAACGTVAGPLAGRVADACGARPTAVVLGVLQGAAALAYAVTANMAAFVAAASAAIAFHAASETVYGALVANTVEGPGRVRARAALHAVTNAGMSLGAALGGLVLQLDSGTAYATAFLVCGALLAAAGLGCLRLPRTAPVPRPAHVPARGVLRDRPFVLFAALNVLLVMNDGLLTVVLPLWIAEHTAAPVSVYSAILVLNTLGIVLLQVRASRGTARLAGGVRALRRSGVLLGACCAVFALASGRPAGWAVAVLLAGAVVHLAGELLYSAGSWSLVFALAPEHAHGRYQGFFNASIQLGGMAAPVLGTTLVLGRAPYGWLAFALLFLLAGAAAPAVARLACAREAGPRVPAGDGAVGDRGAA
ncbi:MFS transporter [Streptomyces sp. ODS28]|uniref:MFS transporter n=1 Tax=Streptomyces sp. ODS28 TaxID=3136688 RepID=UPI0031E5F92B